MPSKYVYEINVVDNQLTSNKKKVEEFRVDITENYSIDLMKSDGQIFCETESYRLSDGRLLLGSVYGEMKDKNVWIVDSEGNAEPLLNMGGYEELSKYVFERRKGLLIWIEPLAVLNDDSVLFYSNKNNARDDFFSNSVYIVDKDKNERIIFDASKYNQDILFVGAEKNIVGFTNNSESLLVYDIANEQIKEIPFKERFPESLSPDGHTILFREKDSVEFYLYDILTNGITYIGMPQGYGYNYIGTWSKSGDKFAFLMNGKEGNDPSKNYTTNVKVAIIDVNDGQLYIYDRPSENSYIYPVGSLSWINNNYVVIYTDDNNSWSLKVE